MLLSLRLFLISFHMEMSRKYLDTHHGKTQRKLEAFGDERRLRALLSYVAFVQMPTMGSLVLIMSI